MKSPDAKDRAFMEEALALARRGQGRVEPNPMVGCVLVRGGRVIGRGYHRRYGGPHAEVHALREAGRRARGCTAVVTLEPCQIHSKTPPCTEALIAAGVARVVAATRDPNPRVGGHGLRMLRRAGIAVRTGVLADAARELIAPFRKMHEQQLPYVIAKWAQSLDGRIATRQGVSKWLSGPASRKLAHGLRGRMDAILVGSNTVLADDPDLTCRNAPLRRTAARVVVDTRLRMPERAKLVRTAGSIPTYLFTSAEAAGRPKARRLAKRGVILEAVRLRRGCVSLRAVMRRLSKLHMTNVLIEGGAEVLGSAFDAGLVDEVCTFVCPKIVGGSAAPGAVAGLGPADLVDASTLDGLSVEQMGPDVVFRGRVRPRTSVI